MTQDVGSRGKDNERERMNQEERTAGLLMGLLLVIGNLAEAYDILGPFEVHAVDHDGKVWNFRCSDAFDPADVLFANPTPPILVRLTDANGRSIEDEIVELTILLPPTTMQ